MGKHRGKSLNQEANIISLRSYLHTSPAELTGRTVWKWLYWFGGPSYNYFKIPVHGIIHL